VVLSDLLGRVLFAPSEIPAGIITALLGAPFFFVLLLQRRNRL
jgi:iron complex transport system permease protein